MTPAHALIVDAMRAGVLLIAQGDRLRYKALASLPPDLAERIKAHKPALLALLRPAPADGPDAPPDATDAPRAKPAGLLAVVRDAFAPLVLDVVDVRHDATWPTRPRNRAARLIRQARRRHGRDRAVALRDEWAERMAICTIDGGQSEADAERIALHELRNSLDMRQVSG